MTYNPKGEMEIPEGVEVTVFFPDGTQTMGIFVRGPRGEGDTFVLRDTGTDKVMYIKNFELMVQK